MTTPERIIVPTDSDARVQTELLTFATAELTSHGVMFFAVLTAGILFIEIASKSLVSLLIETVLMTASVYVLARMFYYGSFVSNVLYCPPEKIEKRLDEWREDSKKRKVRKRFLDFENDVNDNLRKYH